MTDLETHDGSPPKGRKQLVTLFAIAFIPIFVAYGVYFYLPEYMPSTTTNQGQLINPPLQGEASDSWTLLVLVAPDCDDECRNVLYETRQVHIALGKESDRITRELILTQAATGQLDEHLDTEHARAMRRVNRPLYEQLRALAPAVTSLVFVRDPFGNIMMYYRPDQGGKPMLKDLKHLLKVSNIG